MNDFIDYYNSIDQNNKDISTSLQNEIPLDIYYFKLYTLLLGEIICQEYIPGKVKHKKVTHEKPKGGGVINKIREVFHIET